MKGKKNPNKKKPIRRKTKRTKQVKKTKTHSVQTQVEGNVIDQELEAVLESPPDRMKIYRSYRMFRKKYKYPNLFVGGKFPPDADYPHQDVHYEFGPTTIIKRKRK